MYLPYPALSSYFLLFTEQNLTSGTLVCGKTLGDIFERYRDEITPHKKSHRTKHNRLNKFMRHKLAILPLTDIKQSHFYEWTTDALTNFKSRSVNHDLNLLSAVFEQGKRWRWTDYNSISGIKRPKNPQPRERRISKEEIGRIQSALLFDGKTVSEQRHEIAIAFLFALEIAMRQLIWGMKWKDVTVA